MRTKFNPLTACNLSNATPCRSMMLPITQIIVTPARSDVKVSSKLSIRASLQDNSKVSESIHIFDKSSKTFVPVNILAKAVIRVEHDYWTKANS